MKPLVGVTAHRIVVQDVDDVVAMPHEAVASFYVRALHKAGAIPVLLPVVDPDDHDGLDQLLDRFAAIVITGGADVDPTNYGAPVAAACGPVQPDRDRIDLAVARSCLARNQPTLAICRGIQVVNVALGGTLVQHIDDHMVVERYNSEVHGISVEPGSRLATIMGVTEYWSNSLHHQCLDRLGEGVRAVAHADDGTIEAIEIDHAPNVVAVQWHPEMIRHDPAHLALFRALH